MRSPLWPILVCKIPGFWRWKLWDQDFVPFDPGNIQIEENKKTGFTFSIKLKINSEIFSVISWYSYEVTMFWIRGEWRHTCYCTKHFIPGLLFIILLILWKKNLLNSSRVVLTVSHELMKLRSFDWLNYVSTYVTSYARTNINNIPIATYM